jgi:DNA-directed RNA polymerase specialized sigma24 family protein
MINPGPYEALPEKELQNLVVRDDRYWRPALEALFQRYSELVRRRANHWGIDQTQLASRCLIAAGGRRHSLEGRRFTSWLADILDEVASAWDFGSKVWSWAENEGGEKFGALGKKFRFSPDELDDVKQETCRKAVANRSRFDPAKGSLPTWLGTIANHAAIDLQRKKSRSPDSLSVDVEDCREPHET